MHHALICILVTLKFMHGMSAVKSCGNVTPIFYCIYAILLNIKTCNRIWKVCYGKSV